MAQNAVRITTVEMHTGGEPVRIITSGYPEPQGATLLDKRRDARTRLDGWRRLLMAEPRGHADMYGALLVEPDLEGCDLAVLFLHNEGYSTMCGHAVMALGRYAVDRGLVTARGPEIAVRIQCPCGPVEARVEATAGRSTGEVRFTSVPAFVLARDAMMLSPSFGPVTLDVAYGGAFYAVLGAAELGLDLAQSPLARIVAAALEVKEAAAAQLPILHPDEPDLGFLYGTILTDDREDSVGMHVCVFAGGQVDRSPTGSGVTARMALLHRRGRLTAGECKRFTSITGAAFTGVVTGAAAVGPHPAVLVEVAGRAHYTGEAVFTVESDDPLGRGFLLRR